MWKYIKSSLPVHQGGIESGGAVWPVKNDEIMWYLPVSFEAGTWFLLGGSAKSFDIYNAFLCFDILCTRELKGELSEREEQHILFASMSITVDNGWRWSLILRFWPFSKQSTCHIQRSRNGLGSTNRVEMARAHSEPFRKRREKGFLPRRKCQLSNEEIQAWHKDYQHMNRMHSNQLISVHSTCLLLTFIVWRLFSLMQGHKSRTSQIKLLILIR